MIRNEEEDLQNEIAVIRSNANEEQWENEIIKFFKVTKKPEHKTQIKTNAKRILLN